VTVTCVHACPASSSHRLYSYVVPAVTPPGHFTAGGVTSKCPAGFFRAAWKTAAEATSCTACGEGVKADATDRVTQYNILDPTQSTAVNITTSADDCCKLPSLAVVLGLAGCCWQTQPASWFSKCLVNQDFLLELGPAATCCQYPVT
jgi:hypothetical protein